MKTLSRNEMKNIGGGNNGLNFCTADCGIDSDGNRLSVTCNGASGICTATDFEGCFSGDDSHSCDEVGGGIL